MTFEEWFQKEFDYGNYLTPLERLIKCSCENAWNAAKEENQETVSVDFSLTLESWVVRNKWGFAIESDFTYREQAEAWVEQQGYKLE